MRLRVAGKTFEVDFLWRQQRVIVETDGSRLLARAGYRVPRIGWEQLRDEPDRAIAEIARFLHTPASSVPYRQIATKRNN